MAERKIINKNGVDYIVEKRDDGSLVTIGLAGGGQQPVTLGQPDPTFNLKGPQAEANLDKTRDEIIGGAFDRNDKKADNERAMLQLKADLLAKGMRIGADGEPEYIPNWSPPPGTEPASVTTQRDKEKGKQDKAAVVRAIMGRVWELYESDLKGQPLSRAFGATEYIDGWPANEEFSQTANAMLALIRPMVAMGAKDGDSDKEMEVFKAYIPHNDDTDRTIEAKLNNLEILLSGVVDGKLPSQIAAGGALTGRREDAESALGLTNAPPPADNSPGGTNRSNRPNTGGGDGLEHRTGATEKFITELDKERAAKLQKAFDGGASAQQLNAMASDMGMVLSPDELNAAIKYRETKGRGARILPTMTGERNIIENIGAAALDTRVGAAGTRYANAITAGTLDELVGMAGGDADAAQFGKDYASEKYPGWSLAGDMGGALTAMLPLGRGAQVLAKGAGMGSKAVAAAPVAADIAYGGAYGAGEFNDNRTLGFLLGSGGAALGNTIGKYILSPAARAAGSTKVGGVAREQAKKAVNAGRGLLGRAQYPIEPVPPRPNMSQRMVSRRANEGGAIDGAISQLDDAKSLGVPLSIADLNPRLRTLAGSATRKSAATRELAETNIGDRAADQSTRLVSAINRDLAPTGNTDQMSRDLMARARQDAAPLYDEFYVDNRKFAPGEDMASILNTPAGRKAMQRAYRIAANERRDPTALGFDLDDQGEVMLVRNISPQTADYIKRGLDDVLEDARDPITRRIPYNEETRAVEMVRQDFIGEADKLYPKFKAAREAYQGPATLRDALELGTRGDRLSNDDISQAVLRMGKGERDQFNLGYASSMADRGMKLRDTSNPWSATLGSPAQRQKISQVFPEGAENFGRQFDMEKEMAKTAYETLGGSPTAARRSADEQFDEGVTLMGNLAEMGVDAATGNPGSIARQAFQWAPDAVRFGLGKRAENKAETLGKLLLNTNPEENIIFLKAMQDAVDARDIYRAQSRKKWGRTGGIFGASAVGAIPSQ